MSDTVTSLMTGLAEAIRNKSGATGKLSITAMTNAVNGISVNTNPDIDLNGVTVTADKMLSGIVAINSDGKKVTGTIQTVTATKSGDVITVPKGYIAEQQTFNAGVILPTVSVTANKLLNGVTAINSKGETVTGTIPTVTASMSDNVVTVPAGYIASAQTVTIPLAQITETAESVTIGVGYVGQEKTYNLSSGTVSSAEFGYVTADGTIQLYDFTVTPPVEKGSPITADIVTLLPRPYEGEIIEGEYLRFTAVEDSTVLMQGTINKTFSLAYRKNSAYWVEAVANEVIPLKAGEYVEFYGNYQGTTVFDDIFDGMLDNPTIDDTSDEFLIFVFTGKLQGSGYLNSISEFKSTITKGDYRMLLLNADENVAGLISSPIIPKMTAIYNDKTDEFPFWGMIGAPFMTEITVEFTNWNGAEDVRWLYRVAEAGTFRKPASLPTIFGTINKNELCTYIPPNWTVVDI